MKKILVIRFSAMGDVALTMPVVESVLRQNPDVEITFLSRKAFGPLFNSRDRFLFYGVNLKDYDGIGGLFKLYKGLKKKKFDVVIDLHDVLRTKVLRTFFKLNGIPVFTIDKGRKEKKHALLNGLSTPLKHTQQRYLDVFNKAKIQAELDSNVVRRLKHTQEIEEFISKLRFSEDEKIIGFAPYSAHWSKELSEQKVKDLIHLMTQKYRFKVILFGGGNKEKKKIESLSSLYSNCVSAVGLFSLEQELELMQKIDVMVAMDSSNMHLASIVGTKVVSIWCSTHPYLGFSPYRNEMYCVQPSHEEVPCRPCSVFGTLKTKEDVECAKKSIEAIDVEEVIDKITKALKA